MQIVLITNLYEPYNRGGAEVIVKRTARELVAQGHHVTIITAQPWDGFSSLRPSKEQVEGIEIIRFYPLNLFFYAHDHKWPVAIRAIWHAFDLVNIHSAFTIKRQLKELNPDLVITHNLMGLGYAIPHVIKRSKVKHIHVLHDIQLAVRSGVMKKGQEQSWFVIGAFAKLYQAIVRSLFGSPDEVVSPSSFLLKFYEDLGYFSASKKRVLRNPVDERFFNKSEEKKSHDIAQFGYVGQLVEHKGVKMLQKALRVISGSNFALSVVGDGPMKCEVEEWASNDEKMTYLGRIPNDELPRFYQKQDAVIVPTETYENSPTVVYEALASGTPVIVSKIGGAAELITDHENGYTFEPGDTNDLAKKIKLMIQSHHELSKNCHSVVQSYTASNYIKELLGE